MVSIDYKLTGQANYTASAGLPGDIPVTGDFNGDTVSDVGFYRPSTGQWFADLNHTGQFTLFDTFGGGPGWVPVVGDVNGDGRADPGLYGPSSGVWWFDTTDTGKTGVSFTFGGAAGDIPLTGYFGHGARADAVLFNRGAWKVDIGLHNGSPDVTYYYGGNPGESPFITYLSGDHASPNLGLFNSGVFAICYNLDGYTSLLYRNGNPGDLPLTGFFDPTSSVYVNPAGNDANSGGITSPVRTISHAALMIPAGWSIRVAAGTYTENAYMYGHPNGNNIANANIIGAGQSATIIQPASGYALNFDRCSNETLPAGLGWAGSAKIPCSSTSASAVISSWARSCSTSRLFRTPLTKRLTAAPAQPASRPVRRRRLSSPACSTPAGVSAI